MGNPFTNINEFGKKLLFLIFLLSLVGCYSVKIQHTEIKDAIEVSPVEQSKPLQFKKIVVKLDRGEYIGSIQKSPVVIGSIQTSPRCLGHRHLVWKGKDGLGFKPRNPPFRGQSAVKNVKVSTDDFTDVFQYEMEKANYNIIWDTGVLFEDPSDFEAEYVITGIVKEMQANLCWGASSKGEAYMKVNWQLYSRLDRKVVYETITEGTSKVDDATLTGLTDVFLYAFASATKNLLAERAFHDLLFKQNREVINHAREETRNSSNLRIKPYQTL